MKTLKLHRILEHFVEKKKYEGQNATSPKPSASHRYKTHGGNEGKRIIPQEANTLKSTFVE